jgi:hypothetical protein
LLFFAISSQKNLKVQNDILRTSTFLPLMTPMAKNGLSDSK